MAISDRKEKGEKIRWGSGEISGPRHEYRESLMLKIIRYDLHAGSVVLEAGCGSGSLLFKLARFDCMVHGIEQSIEFVGMLSNRLKFSGISNIKSIKEGSVLNIPYPDNNFDVVVSGEVLEHVRDDDAAIREFYRVLRPGGACVVSVPSSPGQWDFSDEWAGHLRRYTREELVNLFEKNGFVVEHVSCWGFPFVRLYHRYIYLPYVRKKISGHDLANAVRPPDAGQHPFMTEALRIIFSMDSLFSWLPFGVGLLIRTRKPGTDAAIELKDKSGEKLSAIGCTP